MYYDWFSQGQVFLQYLWYHLHPHIKLAAQWNSQQHNGGRATGNTELTHREEEQNVVDWCLEINLPLITVKTKKLSRALKSPGWISQEDFSFTTDNEETAVFFPQDTERPQDASVQTIDSE